MIGDIYHTKLKRIYVDHYDLICCMILIKINVFLLYSGSNTTVTGPAIDGKCRFFDKN